MRSAPPATASRDERTGARLDLESEPRRVPREPQQSRRIVDEAAVVKNPENPRLEIGKRLWHHS